MASRTDAEVAWLLREGRGFAQGGGGGGAATFQYGRQLSGKKNRNYDRFAKKSTIFLTLNIFIESNKNNWL